MGYRFSTDGLAVARQTVERCVAKVSRFYKQDADAVLIWNLRAALGAVGAGGTRGRESGERVRKSTSLVACRKQKIHPATLDLCFVFAVRHPAIHLAISQYSCLTPIALRYPHSYVSLDHPASPERMQGPFGHSSIA